MINFKLLENKTVEHKKYLTVVRVLKESVRITIITKFLLDSGVNLTVVELLALVPTVEK